MATLAIGVIGGLISEAGSVGFGLGFALFSGVASMLLAPHAKSPTFRAPNSCWGTPWPIVYNQFRIPGELIQAGEIKPHNNKQKKGGKKFSQTVAFGFGDCRNGQLGRIWADNIVIYDPRPQVTPPKWTPNTVFGAGDLVIASSGSTARYFRATINGTTGPTEPTWSIFVTGITRDGTETWITEKPPKKRINGKSYKYNLTIYDGSEDQLPDPALEELVGVGQQPAYRGLRYIVLEDFDLSAYGNRIPKIESENIVTSGLSPEIFYPLYTNPTDFDADYLNVAVDVPNDRIIQFKNYTVGGAKKFWITKLSTGVFLEEHFLTSIFALSGNSEIIRTGWCLGTDGNFYAMSSDGVTDSTLRLSKVNASWNETANIAPTINVGLSSDEYRLIPFKFSGVNYIAIIVEMNSFGSAPNWFSYIEFINVDTMASVALTTYLGAGIRADLVVGNQVGGNQELFIVEAHYYYGHLFVQKVTFTGSSASVTTIADYANHEVYSAWTDSPPGNTPYAQPCKTIFDPLDGNLITTIGWYGGTFTSTQPPAVLAKISSSAKQIIWSIPVADQDPYSSSGSAQTWQSDVTSGTLLYQTGNNIFTSGYPFTFDFTITSGVGALLLVNTSTGDFEEIDTSHFRFNSINVNAGYVSLGSKLVYYSNFTEPVQPGPWYGGWAVYQPPRSTAFTLADICADISQMVGLSSSQYDYSALASVIPTGCATLNRDPARSFLEGLQPAYFYDLVDIGPKVIGSLRTGGTSILTIPENDLGAGQDSTAIIDRMSTERGADLEIPKDLSINYWDALHDLQSGSQPALRNEVTQYSSGRNTISVPCVMTPGEAANAATRALYLLWAERNKKKLSLPLEYISITPADIFNAINNSRNHTIRATKATLDPSKMTIEVEGVSEDTGIYDLVVPAPTIDLSNGTFTEQTINQIVKPILVLMDTAALRTNELQEPGIYGAGCRSDQAGSWGGGEEVQESVDNSVFNPVGTITTEATIGTSQTILGDCPRFTVWDRTNFVIIKLKNGALGNADESALIAKISTNLGYLSNGEIFQWADATLLDVDDDGLGTYRLSTLLRGRFGTEAFVGTHFAGEDFVVIDETTMQDFAYAPSEINAVRYWKGVNGNPDDLDSGVQTLTMTTRRLMPYAPYFIRGTRDMSGNLTITGLRRMRFKGRPLWVPPETDTPATMEIDILNGTTVVRTLTATLSGAGSGITDAAKFTAYYAAADQVTDFGSTQASIATTSYQRNAVVGRGYGRGATL